MSPAKMVARSQSVNFFQSFMSGSSQTSSSLQSRHGWLFIIFTLVLVWLSDITTQKTFAQGSFQVLVTRNWKKDFSVAVWNAVEKAKTNVNSFLTNAVQVSYETDEELVAGLQEKINDLTNSDFMLILGPATSGEAAMLDEKLTNLTDRILFVSPTISSVIKYKQLRLVRARLADEDRIKYLANVAPKQWKELPAAFIGMDNPWGRPLLAALTRQQTNLCKSLDPHLAAASGVDEFEKFSAELFERRIPLIFVALEDSADVVKFFRECSKQASFFKPYKPMFCLLQDYKFSDTNDNFIAGTEWGSRFSITLASEAIPVSEIETGDMYAQLNEDILSILQHLESRYAANPANFLNQVCSVFENRKEAAALIRDVPVKTSHYLRYLREDASAPYPCVLKWLHTPLNRSPNSASWKNLHPTLVNSFEYRVLFNYRLLCARIPWLSDWRLILLAFGALTAGLFIEFRKRHIFMRRTFWSFAVRLLAWCLILICLFAGIMYVSLGSLVSITSFSGLLLVCLSPLAILPMLQHAAFTRIPVLREVLELPSKVIESGLDKCINSKAKELLKIHRQIIDEHLAEVIQGMDMDLQESTLWSWWFKELRKLRGNGTAKKIFDRFIVDTRVWEKSLNQETRIEKLKEALAYTDMLNEAGGRRKP